MLERILQFSLRHRFAMLVAALAIAALGIWSYQQLPIDAVPDITNVQVQVNTEAAGYTPLEAEQRITVPLERAMSGLRGSGLHAIAVPLRALASDHRFRRWHRYLLRATAGRRAAASRARRHAARDRACHRARGHRSRRNLHVHGRCEAGRALNATDLRMAQDWIVRPQLLRVKEWPM